MAVVLVARCLLATSLNQNPAEFRRVHVLLRGDIHLLKAFSSREAGPAIWFELVLFPL